MCSDYFSRGGFDLYLGGTIHKEIFEFQRILSGPYKGREWDCVVKKVIEDWGAFVRTYV